ncbi:MAG: hypothetical protein ABIO35_05360 [Nitrobacter sp.]
MEAHTVLLVMALDAQAPVGLREVVAGPVSRQEAEALDVPRGAAVERDAQQEALAELDAQQAVEGPVAERLAVAELGAPQGAAVERDAQQEALAELDAQQAVKGPVAERLAVAELGAQQEAAGTASQRELEAEPDLALQQEAELKPALQSPEASVGPAGTAVGRRLVASFSPVRTMGHQILMKAGRL